MFSLSKQQSSRYSFHTVFRLRKAATRVKSVKGRWCRHSCQNAALEDSQYIFESNLEQLLWYICLFSSTISHQWLALMEAVKKTVFPLPCATRDPCHPNYMLFHPALDLMLQWSNYIHFWMPWCSNAPMLRYLNSPLVSNTCTNDINSDSLLTLISWSFDIIDDNHFITCQVLLHCWSSGKHEIKLEPSTSIQPMHI